MELTSVWKKNTESADYPAQSGNIETDVVIIGGGITGITAAYLLAISGRKSVVLEALRVGQGSTGFSTGNLYATVGSEGMHKIVSGFDQDKLREVVESRGAAVNFIEQAISTHAIDCDFKRVPWSLFNSEGEDQSFVEKEKEAAVSAGLTVTSDISFPAAHGKGFTVPDQAQFDPYTYVVSLAKTISSEHCQIFENSRVTKVEEGNEREKCVVHTENGTVTANLVIMATHTPKGLYMVHTSMGPYREYAVAAKLKGEYPQPGIFWEMKGTEHFSMRVAESPQGPVMLVLGEKHKVGQKENNPECFDRLEKFLRDRFEVDSVAYKWAAQNYTAADGIPFIGMSSGDSKTYIATGFAADGLTYGTLAAMIITDDILGIQNKWAKTYDASRLTPLASAKNFVKENVNVAFEIARDWLTKDEADSFAEVQKCDGKIMNVEGSKHAVHRDENGELHVVSAVCPHMGCIVHFNTAEQTWDCPCHGSRFTTAGDVIEGPAINPLKKINIQ